MKIFLILPILTIAIPFIIGGICLIKDHIKTIKKDKAQSEEDKQWFYNKVWNGNWENEGEKIDIRNIPQLSFEKYHSPGQFYLKNYLLQLENNL